MGLGREEKIELLHKLDEGLKREAEKSLHVFIRLLWDTVEPSRPFIDNWHIGAICEHLEAVRSRQIKNLLINQPPATMKSVTVSVMFPAWCWATAAWMRFMCLSYDQSLSTRDNVRMRNVIESQAYQERWPVEFSKDQNEKTKYATVQGGWRIGTSLTGRIVGEHPHGKIVDDPHNTKAKLLSEKDIQDAVEAWDYGLSSRGATMGAWTILLMQRLHEKDLSGHVLAQNIGSDDWVHLCLPMRYEPPAWVQVGANQRELRPRMKTTPLGWNDPRTVAGELLWPAMWPDDLVDSIVRTQLGPWGEAGQFQQRPTPAGGLLFQRTWFNLIERAPANVVRWVRFWDVAGTEGGLGARTAGVKIGKTADGRFVIDGLVVKGRWDESKVQQVIEMTARLDGVKVAIREECEPGSSGKAVIAARLRSLAGYDYKGVGVTGDKVTRARPLMVQAAGRNVDVVVGDEHDTARRVAVNEFFNELETFPLGATRDQVDAAAGGFNDLVEVGDGYGMLYAGQSSDEVEDELARLKRELGLT